jgi:hypothetical protein
MQENLRLLLEFRDVCDETMVGLMDWYLNDIGDFSDEHWKRWRAARAAVAGIDAGIDTEELARLREDRRLLLEYRDAMFAVDEGINDFTLHSEQVDRLRAARAAVAGIESEVTDD